VPSAGGGSSSGGSPSTKRSVPRSGGEGRVLSAAAAQAQAHGQVQAQGQGQAQEQVQGQGQVQREEQGQGFRPPAPPLQPAPRRGLSWVAPPLPAQPNGAEGEGTGGA